MSLTTAVINFLSVLTLSADIFLLLLVIYALLRLVKKIDPLEDLLDWLGERALLLGFIVALGATLGSLFLSQIAGYAPCDLCWYQRIFMYSQTVILLLTWLKPGQRSVDSIIALSLIGAGFSVYNYYLQLYPPPVNICLAGADCSAKIIFAYNYITFAVMALTASALNFSLMILFKRVDSKLV